MDLEKVFNRLTGCYVTIPTPFRDADFSIDFAAIERHVEFLISNGIVTGNGVLLSGGAAGDFVATGLVTEPGLKLTTSNVNCPANSICNDRGTLTLSFGQAVKNPVFSFAGWGGRSDGTSCAVKEACHN